MPFLTALGFLKLRFGRCVLFGASGDCLVCKVALLAAVVLFAISADLLFM